MSTVGAFIADLVTCGGAEDAEPASVAAPPAAATPAAARPAVPLLAGLALPGVPSEALPQIGKFLTIEELGSLAVASRSLRQPAAEVGRAVPLYVTRDAVLPMKRAAFNCFSTAAPEGHFLSSGFTAACGPLLAFLHPNQRTRLVDQAINADPPTHRHAIAGLLAGLSHLSDADQARLIGAVREHKVIAGIQLWDGAEIRTTVARAIGRGLLPGQAIQAADVAALGSALACLTEVEVSRLIRDAVDIHDLQARHTAVVELCSGLKLLDAPQPDDLTRLLDCLSQPQFSLPGSAKAKAIAGLGEVMNRLTHSQREQLYQLTLDPTVSRGVAMAGIGRGIAQLPAGEAGPHVNRALAYVADHMQGPFAPFDDDIPVAIAIAVAGIGVAAGPADPMQGPFAPFDEEMAIAIAIAGIGVAAGHMTAAQRGALLGAALACPQATTAVALAGLCSGMHAMDETERARLLAAVLASPAQTRAVAIAGMGAQLAHLNEAQTEELMAAAVVAAMATDYADDDASFNTMAGLRPAVEGITALAGVATGMQSRLVDLAEARRAT